MRGHIADACHTIAIEMDDDEAIDYAHNHCQQRVGLRLPDLAKLCMIREWLATYPPIPADANTTGDPETTIVRRLRHIIGEDH